MIITKQIEIDMGHRVSSHTGKCRHLHGHRYKIELAVDGKVPQSGMVIDYGILKEILVSEIENQFDHKLILSDEDTILDGIGNSVDTGVEYVSFIPTAENLAKHWYELIKIKLQQHDIAIKFVKVWETPTSTAFYEE